jgi:hypothetical protein
VLNLGRNGSWRGSPLVLNGERLRILSILVHEHEEPAFLDAQDLLDVRSFDLLLTVPSKKLFDLVWRKSHNLRPPQGFGLYPSKQNKVPQSYPQSATRTPRFYPSGRPAPPEGRWAKISPFSRPSMDNSNHPEEGVHF